MTKNLTAAFTLAAITLASGCEKPAHVKTVRPNAAFASQFAAMDAPCQTKEVILLANIGFRDIGIDDPEKGEDRFILPGTPPLKASGHCEDGVPVLKFYDLPVQPPPSTPQYST